MLFLVLGGIGIHVKFQGCRDDSCICYLKKTVGWSMSRPFQSCQESFGGLEPTSRNLCTGDWKTKNAFLLGRLLFRGHVCFGGFKLETRHF